MKTPEFYDKYPLIYFWFCKNLSFKYGDIFIKNYNIKEKEDILLGKELPFWLFCLRIHSSINFIFSERISYIDFKIRNIIYSHILKNKYKNNCIENIGITWINLLLTDNFINVEDDFINSFSIFIKNLKKDNELNEKLKKNEKSRTNICIFNQIRNLVTYFFDNSYYLKNDLFIFFSDIKGQIKNELIKLIRNEYKDYLINGKYLTQFINKITIYKDNIIKEQNKFELNYQILKNNLISALLTGYKKQIDSLKNQYTKLVDNYNSIIKNNNYYYGINIQGNKLENIENEIDNIELKLKKYNIKIIKEIRINNELSTKINLSKYKYIIKDTNKNKNSIKYIYCEELFVMETNKNEGYFYFYNDNEYKNFTCEDKDCAKIQIQCELIKICSYERKNISFIDENNSENNFNKSIEIKIGNMTKDKYIDKISLIIEIIDKINNNKNNEANLFKFINDLNNNHLIKNDYFIPPNDTLNINQNVNYNTNLKAQIEDNIMKINKEISFIICKGFDCNKYYEAYQLKINKIKIDNLFNKDYSLIKINNEDFNNFKINFEGINKNIILDYTPIIYYDNKTSNIKCIYKEINYTTNIFLYDYYKYAEMNILSNLNYNTNIELDSEQLKYIELTKKEFKSNSISKIKLIPMENEKENNKTITYNFNFILEKFSIKTFSINCYINISFSKLYIYLKCEEYSLIYDEKQNLFTFNNMECLYENEEINIKCISQINTVNVLPKVILISDKENNNANKPTLKITNNNILFIINTNNERESILNFTALVYFTNELFIKILFNTKIKKINYQLLCFDYNKSQFIKDNPFLYLNNYILNEKDEFIYEQYLYLINESNKIRNYEIKVNNINSLNKFLNIFLYYVK